MGLVNRHAGKPVVLGQINPNDALWLSSAQEDGIISSNDTVQNLASLKDLTTLALGQGMSPVMIKYLVLLPEHHKSYQEKPRSGLKMLGALQMQVHLRL